MTKNEKIAQINARLAADIAAEKARKEQADADYYAKVAELQREACELKALATDDDEPQPETAKDRGDAAQIHYDGTQTSLIRTIVAIFNDSPALPAGCSFDVSVFHHSHRTFGLDDTDLHVSAYNGNVPSGSRKSITLDISESDTPEEQQRKYAEWRGALDYHFSQGKEEDNE